MTIPEFIQKWNVAFESKEEEAEFAAEMEADIKSLISSRPEPEQVVIKLPCGCDTDHSPVFWNPYNNVVQCHRCGATYSPNSVLTPSDPAQPSNDNIGVVKSDISIADLRKIFAHRASRII